MACKSCEHDCHCEQYCSSDKCKCNNCQCDNEEVKEEKNENV